MPGRAGSSEAYRYGFNGKEKDDEGEFGSLTAYDYGFRIYNPAIAKFLSVDPLTSTYPMLTPYQFAANRPINGVDLDGLEWKARYNSAGDPYWFDWDIDNAYEQNEQGQCVLKNGYYKYAFVFDGNTGLPHDKGH